MDPSVDVTVVGNGLSGKRELCRRLQEGPSGNTADPELRSCHQYLSRVSLPDASRRMQRDQTDFDTLDDTEQLRLRWEPHVNADRATLRSFMFNRAACTVVTVNFALLAVQTWVHREGQPTASGSVADPNEGSTAAEGAGDEDEDDVEAIDPVVVQKISLNDWRAVVHDQMKKYYGDNSMDPAKIPLVVAFTFKDVLEADAPTPPMVKRHGQQVGAFPEDFATQRDAMWAAGVDRASNFIANLKDELREMVLALGYHDCYFVSAAPGDGCQSLLDAQDSISLLIKERILSQPAYRNRLSSVPGVVDGKGRNVARRKKKSSWCAML